MSTDQFQSQPPYTSASQPSPHPAPFRAAQYVRMSTEHQQYSTNNQADKILEYAQRRNIEIVRTYADEGKSGLSLGGRASLQKLIADVETGVADFTLVLVYDVSRWGRFQDADEAAFYEYKLKRKGILVAYVAEQFENDGSPVSTIVKGVKRAMAGEYSRELSAKVFAGQCRLIELGFRQGGPAGFGLRRVLLDQSGNLKSALQRGEHKSLQTDRVILVPGTDEEVATVNQMFQWLIQDDLAISAIANRLNAIPILTDLDRPWNYSTVRQVLTNEKYIGNNVYNRHSFKLKKKHVDNPPDMWIRKEGAFTGVVPVATFMTAQEILAERSRKLTDQELLEHLMGILLDLAEKLLHRTDVGFLFVGRGSDVKKLAADAQARGLKNVLFQDEIHPDEIPGLYAQCQVGLVALDPRHKSHNIPGKFLTYMQSGLPVLANINAGYDLAGIIRHENVGRVSEDGSADTLAQLALEMIDSLWNDGVYKERCRTLYARLFAPETAVRQIVSALKK